MDTRAVWSVGLLRPALVKVQVLYFAVLRERVRLDEEQLDVAEGLSVEDLLAALAHRHPALVGLLPHLSVAVNRKVVPRATRLRADDEVALLPPVAGGADPRRVAIETNPLSLDEVVAAVQGPGQGGLVTFTGTVRDHGHHAQVVRLEYEAFVPMAIQVMTALADEVQAEWPGTRVAVHHRLGALGVGELAVVIAVSAPHRAEAFDACRAVIDRLKERVPIWKKEIGADGATWVGLGP